MIFGCKKDLFQSHWLKIHFVAIKDFIWSSAKILLQTNIHVHWQWFCDLHSFSCDKRGAVSLDSFCVSSCSSLCSQRYIWMIVILRGLFYSKRRDRIKTFLESLPLPRWRQSSPREERSDEYDWMHLLHACFSIHFHSNRWFESVCLSDFSSRTDRSIRWISRTSWFNQVLRKSISEALTRKNAMKCFVCFSMLKSCTLQLNRELSHHHRSSTYYHKPLTEENHKSWIHHWPTIPVQNHYKPRMQPWEYEIHTNSFFQYHCVLSFWLWGFLLDSSSVIFQQLCTDTHSLMVNHVQFHFDDFSQSWLYSINPIK